MNIKLQLQTVSILLKVSYTHDFLPSKYFMKIVWRKKSGQSSSSFTGRTNKTSDTNPVTVNLDLRTFELYI